MPFLDPSIDTIFNTCEKAVLPLEEKEEKEEYVEEKDYIDCIWKAVTSFGFFDPNVQPDEDWYRRNILAILVANGSEQDFVVRCWSNLDRCFEGLGVVARDRTCNSTLVRVNSERRITGLEPIEEQQSSVRPDFLVMKEGFDFAVGECGKEDLGRISKKEIIERQLHVPKIMKNILHQILIKFNHDAYILRGTLKVGALQESGVLYLTAPEYNIPENADMISTQLFPIMKRTLQIKTIVKASMKAVKKQQREQAKKEMNSTMSTLETQTTNTILRIPETFTIPNAKKLKTNSSDDVLKN
ncbi:hypothetical protein BDC45DRAFT_576118 [Circinella umbellata]|nr:hypothetical protein BDC45DRAFT_576118 [Circinella umbellata]